MSSRARIFLALDDEDGQVEPVQNVAEQLPVAKVRRVRLFRDRSLKVRDAHLSRTIKNAVQRKKAARQGRRNAVSSPLRNIRDLKKKVCIPDTYTDTCQAGGTNKHISQPACSYCVTKSNVTHYLSPDNQNLQQKTVPQTTVSTQTDFRPAEIQQHSPEICEELPKPISISLKNITESMQRQTVAQEKILRLLPQFLSRI